MLHVAGLCCAGRCCHIFTLSGTWCLHTFTLKSCGANSPLLFGLCFCAAVWAHLNYIISVRRSGVKDQMTDLGINFLQTCNFAHKEFKFKATSSMLKGGHAVFQENHVSFVHFWFLLLAYFLLLKRFALKTGTWTGPQVTVTHGCIMLLLQPPLCWLSTKC